MERLQKVMAHAGVDSRRKCETIIQEGRVTVNGTVVTELGFKVSANDKIEVDGVPIYREHPVYFLMYKRSNFNLLLKSVEYLPCTCAYPVIPALTV